MACIIVNFFFFLKAYKRHLQFPMDLAILGMT